MIEGDISLHFKPKRRRGRPKKANLASDLKDGIISCPAKKSKTAKHKDRTKKKAQDQKEADAVIKPKGPATRINW